MEDWALEYSEIFWEYSETFKTGVFLNIPREMHGVIFSEACRFLIVSNPATLIKWPPHRSYPREFPTVSEHSQETFFLEYVIGEARIKNCRPIGTEKKTVL